jgi:hypothetical protein
VGHDLAKAVHDAINNVDPALRKRLNSTALEIYFSEIIDNLNRHAQRQKSIVGINARESNAG